MWFRDFSCYHNSTAVPFAPTLPPPALPAALRDLQRDTSGLLSSLNVVTDHDVADKAPTNQVIRKHEAQKQVNLSPPASLLCLSLAGEQMCMLNGSIAQHASSVVVQAAAACGSGSTKWCP